MGKASFDGVYKTQAGSFQPVLGPDWSMFRAYHIPATFLLACSTGEYTFSQGA
jgi:hypothetical protein